MPLPLPTAAQPATLTATRVATIATRTFFIVGPCFPLLSLTRVHTKIAQRSSAQRPHWGPKHLSAPDSNRTVRSHFVWKFWTLLGIGPAATVMRDRPGTPQVVLNQLFGWRSFAAGLALGVCEGAVPPARGAGGPKKTRGDSIPSGGHGRHAGRCRRGQFGRFLHQGALAGQRRARGHIMAGSPPHGVQP